MLTLVLEFIVVLEGELRLALFGVNLNDLSRSWFFSGSLAIWAWGWLSYDSFCRWTSWRARLVHEWYRDCRRSWEDHFVLGHRTSILDWRCWITLPSLEWEKESEIDTQLLWIFSSCAGSIVACTWCAPALDSATRRAPAGVFALIERLAARIDSRRKNVTGEIDRGCERAPQFSKLVESLERRNAFEPKETMYVFTVTRLFFGSISKINDVELGLQYLFEKGLKASIQTFSVLLNIFSPHHHYCHRCPAASVAASIQLAKTGLKESDFTWVLKGLAILAKTLAWRSYISYSKLYSTQAEVTSASWAHYGARK